MDVDSIKTLVGFPPTSSNGVHFDVEEIILISANDGTSTDISGKLIIILRASISGESQTKEITISDFKTRSLTQDETDVANALTNASISGDNSKLPSAMDVDLIKALSSFPPKSNGVDFDVEIVQSNNEYGTLIITLIATKNHATKKQELTISGFQTEDQAAVDAYKELIVHKTKILTDNSETLASEISYNNFSEFYNEEYDGRPFYIQPKDITIQFNVVNDDIKGEQDVTFTIIKGDAKATHSIKIIGFRLSSGTRTEEQTESINNQMDVEYAITFFYYNNVTTKKNSKLSSEVKYNNLEDFKIKTNAQFGNLNSRYNIAINVISKNGWQIVHFIVTYNDAIAIKTVMVNGFKKQI